MHKEEVIGIVDVNNCYASAERVFRPELRNTPIAVLSNNDGCIIARSQEVKDMGFKMGDPYFKNKELFEWLGVQIFSSNYGFYHDMTHRVFWTLKRFCEDVDIYSIDEAFILLNGYTDPTQLALKMRKEVLRRAKIPVSIGLAPTKTLAKLANHIAKKNPKYNGVFNLCGKDLTPYLKDYPIDDIWGIGRQYSKFLKERKITTALQFTQLPYSWVKSNLTVMGVRVQQELLGKRMLPLTTELEPKKGIGSSRSFSEGITNERYLREAIASHIDHAAKKLRGQNYLATRVGVYIRTNVHSKDPKYFAGKSLNVKDATAYTPKLIATALKAFDQIYKSGFRYWKVGITLKHLVPDNPIQLSLFKHPNYWREKEVMRLYDKLNSEMGPKTLNYQPIVLKSQTQKWGMKREMLSPFYTTKWQDIPKVK